MVMQNGLRATTPEDEAFARTNMMRSDAFAPTGDTAKYLQPQPQTQGKPAMPAMNSLSQEQMMAVNNITDPDEKAALIRKLTQDYKGKQSNLSEQMRKGEADMIPQTKGIHGGGGGDNPKWYVGGNALGHLADGIRGYKGKKSYDEGLEASKLLSDEYGAGQRSRFEAGLDADKRRIDEELRNAGLNNAK